MAKGKDHSYINSLTIINYDVFFFSKSVNHYINTVPQKQRFTLL